jgi:hypothetical protein
MEESGVSQLTMCALSDAGALGIGGSVSVEVMWSENNVHHKPVKHCRFQRSA